MSQIQGMCVSQLFKDPYKEIFENSTDRLVAYARLGRTVSRIRRLFCLFRKERLIASKLNVTVHKTLFLCPGQL